MKVHFALIATALFGLSACSHKPIPPITETVLLQADDPADGGDFLAPRRRAGDAVPGFLGLRPTELRARYLAPDFSGLDADDGAVEGAACDLTADGASLRIHPPVRIMLPVYDGPAPSIEVSCTGIGAKPTIVVLDSRNSGDRQAGAALSAGGPLIGLLAAAESLAKGEFDGT